MEQQLDSLSKRLGPEVDGDGSCLGQGCLGWSDRASGRQACFALPQQRVGAQIRRADPGIRGPAPLLGVAAGIDDRCLGGGGVRAAAIAE